MVELCDLAHLGIDDNCNGQVDEGCPCIPGQAHACFMGDAIHRHDPGCFDGTELCTEESLWGPCTGGVHATPPDDCYLDHTKAPHAITTRPFHGVHLATGLGTFGDDALPNSQTWTVTCPIGVSACPSAGGPKGPDHYVPLQSGEYLVTYTKAVPGGGTDTATYPLIVRTIGLRIELDWEHTPADNGVDLDLHVHQPNDTKPWAISPGAPNDCSWANCTVQDFIPPQSFAAPAWFADSPAMSPNWSKNLSSPDDTTCYDAPRGVGAVWASAALGCHNPRLDADNITCDATVTDPTDYAFCTPENINVDYPPLDQWIRIGVDYYHNHGLAYDVHPTVRVVCDGALSGMLGPNGYYVPQTPVTFEPSDGASVGGNRFWLVADVMFPSGAPGSCVVRPLHADEAARTPVFLLDSVATSTFGPPYPMAP
ncbi:Hypothetical protein A7982_02409 [Minicystis rosea]|nr:Hypothetical protein A7982_02409 [Minicystis rosea]